MKRPHSEFVNRKIGAIEASYIFKPVEHTHEQEKELIEELVEATFEEFTRREREMFHTIEQTMDGELNDITELEHQLDEQMVEEQSLRLHVGRMTADGAFMSLESASSEIERLESIFEHGNMQAANIGEQEEELHLNVSELESAIETARLEIQELQNSVENIAVTYQ